MAKASKASKASKTSKASKASKVETKKQISVQEKAISDNMGLEIQNGSILKRFVMTPGAMLGLSKDGKSLPLFVRCEGMGGTQGHNETGNNTKNMTRGELCFTSPDAHGLRLQFQYHGLPIGADEHVETAGDPRLTVGFKAGIATFLKLAKTSHALKEVSRKIANNILAGKWGNRNSAMAAKKIITVSWNDKEGKVKSCVMTWSDANTSTFDGAGPEDVAAELAAQYTGDSMSCFSVNMDIIFRRPGMYEVYPSQTMEDRKGRFFQRDPFDDSKLIINSRKIWNQLRRVDTAYTENGASYPISVEPLGGDKKANQNFRSGSNSFYSLLADLLDPNKIKTLLDGDQGEYMVAMFIRGNVITVTKNKKED